MNSRQTPDAKRIVVLAAALLAPAGFLATGNPAPAALVTQLTNFKQIDSPQSSSGTFAVGVSGGTVVGGFYSPATVSNGFAFNAPIFTPFNVTNSSTTVVSGISGNTQVGSYTDGNGTHGFRLDGSGFSSLNYPGVSPAYTVATGVDGNNIVGYVNGSAGIQGFLYDGTNWSTPVTPPPGTQLNVARGIGGSEIVGYYMLDNHIHAFMQPISLSGGGSPLAGGSAATPPFTTLDYPGSISTAAYGISGNLIVGDYQDSLGKYFGFIYDDGNWLSVDTQTLLNPLSGQSGAGSASSVNVTATKLYGISGGTIVGEYLDGSGINHGFEVQVPEPSTALLLALGAALAAVLWCGRLASLKAAHRRCCCSK